MTVPKAGSGRLCICMVEVFILKFDIEIAHTVWYFFVSPQFHIYRVLFLDQWIIRKMHELVNDIKRFSDTYHDVCL